MSLSIIPITRDRSTAEINLPRVIETSLTVKVKAHDRGKNTQIPERKREVYRIANACPIICRSGRVPWCGFKIRTRNFSIASRQNFHSPAEEGEQIRGSRAIEQILSYQNERSPIVESAGNLTGKRIAVQKIAKLGRAVKFTPINNSVTQILPSDRY